MSRNFAVRWPVFSFAFVFLSALLPELAQAPAQSPQQSSERAALSMEQEHHHHLEFENSYVRVFFVEIPAHESTLFHRHDYPYISVQPTGPDASMPSPPGASAERGVGLLRNGYSPGNFSHTVSNSRDFPLRNVAIELLRPQGRVRNRCEQVIRDQPFEQCDLLKSGTHMPLFESDELLVEKWRIGPDARVPPWNDYENALVASLSGISVIASGGIDSANALKGGLLWLPAGCKPIFKTASGGSFIAITFKDSD